MWQWIIAWLVWLSADPAAVDLERPRCAAAVSAARASLIVDPAPGPEPTPADECCGECNGSGYIVMPAGHRVACPCPPDCDCKTASVIVPGGCPDGKCATPGASPATDSPATTASGR